MYKKIITLLILVLFVCSGCGDKKEKEIVPETALDIIMHRGSVNIGIKTDSYPFGFIDKNGNYAGFDIDLANLIGKKLFGTTGKVKLIPVTSSNRIMKLYSEDIDMIVATMSITPQRQNILDFSSPYYTAGQAILVRANSPIKTLRDLKGKKAIIVFGSTSETSLRGTVPNLKIIGYKTYNDAHEALKQGKADAIVSDNTILLGIALNDSSVKLLPKKYSKEPYAVAFKKDTTNEGLIKAVNMVISEETRNGNLKKLQQKYGIK